MQLDAVLPFTLRRLFILLADVLSFIFLYWVILSEFFHLNTPHETAHALLWYIQLPSWQNQPRIAKMAEVKADDQSRHRKARSGSDRPEFTLQGWHRRHSSWTSKPGPRQD